ncbi:LysR family transcriptional regulator [Streptomyces sp. NPDC004134]|uniref:LysR family transcriptional regulator n=1 Tax=Streptomyces sp. NPDC004134 TaxID=3364691 RepID=UPI0036838F61
MRIQQLEYVAAVTRFGSLRRAAEALHLSQPALSETVRNLERELGVDLLDRRRSGARISDAGRELLPHIAAVLDAVDRLRRAADEQHRVSRSIRLGTGGAVAAPLLAPAVREFRAGHPQTGVEIVAGAEEAVRRGLVEGGLDLGLVVRLAGEEPYPDLHDTELLRGRPVVCLSPGSPLAELDEIGAVELLAEPLVGARSGCLVHRLLHRLGAARPPLPAYAADTPDAAKHLVAEGLGVTVLPDFGVVGDPLERHGAVTWRPLAGAAVPAVHLMLWRSRTRAIPPAARVLHDALAAAAAAAGPVSA